MLSADSYSKPTIMPEIDSQAARPENISPQPSPRWGPMTKTVVGLTVIAIIGALIIWFRGIIGPLILALSWRTCFFIW
jgi:hypothetical protein